MDKDTFKLLYADMQTALTESRLLDALNALEGLISYTENWECRQSLLELRESYGMLLGYMARGFEDAEREQLFGQFVRRAYELSDRAYRDFLLSDSQSHYASVWNVLQRMSQPCTLEELYQRGGSYRQLFEVAWTAPVWRKNDYEAALLIMESEKWQEYERCLLLSGATLAALQFFDFYRLKFLLDMSVDPVLSFRTRALTGVVLVYLLHGERCRHYPEIEEQLRLMFELPGVVDMLRNLQMQLFLTLETKEIERSLREEILPGIMQKAKDIRLDKSLGFEEMQEKFNELNPEWEADGKMQELTGKMKELANLQQKGADVYLGSFKMFKQKFPFFSVAANWFCPFTLQHPELGKMGSGTSFLKTFLEMGNLCDSDKYSFCLLFREMPAAERDLLESQLPGDSSGLHEMLSPGGGMPGEDPTVRSLRAYVQDLYRFFTLFRYRGGMENPFVKNLLLMDYRPFDELLADVQTVRQLADFSFKEKSYLYALKFYEHLPASAETYEKIGFCHQSVKNYAAAVSAYEKATLLQENSAWRLRQTANCYRALGEWEQARKSYEMLENLLPEDVSVLLHLSECYLHEKNYEQAFSKLYKADYLAPDSKVAVRALAWCSILTGKMEQACSYYKRILEEKPEAEDYFNAGHAAWLQGDVAAAVAHYRKSLAMASKDFAPVDFFDADAPVLQQHGKTVIDLRLMVDILNYRQSEP